jgi:hypothetical protein
MQPMQLEHAPDVCRNDDAPSCTCGHIRQVEWTTADLPTINLQGPCQRKQSHARSCGSMLPTLQNVLWLLSWPQRCHTACGSCSGGGAGAKERAAGVISDSGHKFDAEM